MSSPFRGVKIGKFLIKDQLGRGGMGEVYLATDTEANRLVALKLIYRKDDDAEAKMKAEERGAKLQKKLSSKDHRIVKVYEWGETPDHFFVSMEYIDGSNLKGPLFADAAAKVAIDICEALHVVHNLRDDEHRGIAHGDIKPGNIRITSNGGVKIMDFGTAKFLKQIATGTVMEGLSPAYSSPEKLKSGKMTEQSDLWSVGVTLYEILFDKLPFTARNTEALEKLIQSGPRVKFPDSPPCPNGLKSIITKMLSREVASRYQNALEVVEDLRRFQSGLPTRAEQEEETEPTRPYQPNKDARFGGQQDIPTVKVPTPDPAPQKSKRDGELKKRIAAMKFPKLHMPGRRAIRRTALIIMALAVTAFLGNEALVLYKAFQLRKEVASEQLNDMNQAWSRYEKLSNQSYLKLSLIPAKSALRDRFVSEADRVIANYRNNVPSVRHGDWKTQADGLSRALVLYINDAEVKGRLRLCQGHVQRINGETNRPNQPQEARKRFQEAAQFFEEAKQLKSGWVDPYLGLVVVYIYGLGELEKAQETIAELERLGFHAGKREKASLADGYKARATELYRKSRAIRDRAQRDEAHNKVITDLDAAMAIYKELMPFGNSTKNSHEAQTLKTTIENGRRLNEQQVVVE